MKKLLKTLVVGITLNVNLCSLAGQLVLSCHNFTYLPIYLFQQKQDFFSEFSPSLSPNHQKIKKHCCTPTSEPVTPVRKPVRKKSLNLEQRIDNSEYEIQRKQESRPQERVICDCCPIREKNGDMEFLYAFVSVNVKDKVLPPSFSKGKLLSNSSISLEFVTALKVS